MGETLPAASRRRSAHLVLAVLATVVLAGAGLAPRASAADGDLTGIDVSHWQGEIRWSDVIADGVDFAIAKATEGQTFQDGQYARNKERADTLGLPFTAYHFARPDRTVNDALLEADHFADAAALGPGNLRPVLDLERSGGMGPRRLKRWVKAWLAEVEARVGVKPIIYTSPAFWRDNMDNSRWFSNNGYALWIAHWHVAAPRVPAQNWAGRGWTIWQHDGCGSVSGIDGCVDLDRLNGTDIDALRIPTG